MGRVLSSIAPATGEVLWSGETGNVDDEVGTAAKAWPGWAARPLSVRIELLRRFANVVRARGDAFAELIAREIGAPLWEARSELDHVVERVDLSVTGSAERTPRRQFEGALGARSSVRHKPHGVLAVITPFCAPAGIPADHIIPALIAGNTIVFKPSERAVASGAMLVACCHEAGIPEGVIRLLIGDATEGQALAAHPDVCGVLFTGTARAGLSLHRQLADAPGKIAALEMGGNNPIIIWDAPDSISAAAIVVRSAFLSAGQRCTAARRLIIRDGDHEPLLREIGKLMSRLIIDEPLAQPQPYLGPMIDNAAADEINEAFLNLMMKGGQPLQHMARPKPDLPFLTPGVIDVTRVQNRPDTEYFGPLLQLVRVPDFDAAIHEANATRYGLSASLISRSPELYDKFWSLIRAGSINWNNPTNAPPMRLPFGGIGLSGNHRPGGQYAADFCAYPVTSSESEQLRASIGIGLRDS